jgi:drug/metabolite transporter (DMT)-like permease
VTIPVLVALLVGTVLPALTAVFTRKTASPRVKAIVTAAMSTLTGIILTASSSPPHGWHAWEELIVVSLLSWASASAAYWFGWKPTGAADKIATATSRFGIR